jgi:hypothetical protein
MAATIDRNRTPFGAGAIDIMGNAPNPSPLTGHQPLAHLVAAGAGEPFVVIEFDPGRFPVDNCAASLTDDGRLMGLSWERADGDQETVDLAGAADAPLLAMAVHEDAGLLIVQVTRLEGAGGLQAQGDSFSVQAVAAGLSCAPSAPRPGRDRS